MSFVGGGRFSSRRIPRVATARRVRNCVCAYASSTRQTYWTILQAANILVLPIDLKQHIYVGILS